MKKFFSEIVIKIKEASSNIINNAREINKGNLELSNRTQEQASSLEETAASVEEMEKTDQFSLGSTAQSLVFGSLFQAVIGLIVGAIMKKSNPDE